MVVIFSTNIMITISVKNDYQIKLFIKYIYILYRYIVNI